MVTRFLALDSIRGVCAILVALLHFPASGYFSALIHNAHLFVDFFFVLSGFVIMHAYGGRAMNPRTFLIRRIGRVWPLHIAMLGVLIALEVVRLVLQSRGMAVGPAAFVDEREPLSIVTNVLLVHSWGLHSHDTWNGPSWSISVELLAYIVFAASTYLPWRRLFAVGIALGAWVLIMGIAPEGMASTYDFGVFRGLLGFFLGVLVYGLRPWRGTLAECSCIGLVVLVLRVDAVSLAAPAVFALTVSTFSAEAGAISRLLTCRGPRKLGEWSYSIYMVHAPVMLCALAGGILVQKVTGIRLVEGSTFAFGPFGDLAALAYLVVITAASSVTYKWIERPFRVRFNGLADTVARRDST